MRPLSPALAEAVGAGGATPLVRLELLDVTPRYVPLFASGPVGRNAAALTLDGAVAQAYQDAAGTVYTRRVPDPTVVPWGAWMPIAAGADTAAGVALARLDDRLRLLWQDGATTAVRAVDSFDGGVTWAAPATLFDPGARLAAVTADGTVGVVFVAYATGGGSWRVAVWSFAGVWQGADWTNGDVGAVAGLHALRRDGDSFLLALAAQPNVGAGVALLVCGYRGTWDAPLTVVPPDASGNVNAGIRLAAPRLAAYDGRYHLAYSVVDAGAPSPLAAAHVALTHSADGAHWTDPLEDAGIYAYGAVPLRVAAGYLLAAPDASALAPPAYDPNAPNAPGRYADLSAALSRLEVVHKDGLPARLVVTVQQGLFDDTPLRLNAALRLSLGYAGAGIVPAWLFFIEDWSLVRAADEDELVITASDRTTWLDRQSRTTLLYVGQTVGWLAREITTRAGLVAVETPATAQFAYPVSVFAVPAGSTWRAALQRLGRLYGFDAAARIGPDGTDTLVLYEKGPSDAPAWRYAYGTGTGVEHLVIARGLDRANHVIVFGAGAVIGEAWDWADVAETGQERYLHAIETLITTVDGAALRAALDLQREARLAWSGSLSAPLHPGLELWDVLSVGDTDAAPALRVATLHEIYEPQRGVYDMVVTLEGV